MTPTPVLAVTPALPWTLAAAAGVWLLVHLALSRAPAARGLSFLAAGLVLSTLGLLQGWIPLVAAILAWAGLRLGLALLEEPMDPPVRSGALHGLGTGLLVMLASWPLLRSQLVGAPWMEAWVAAAMLGCAAACAVPLVPPLTETLTGMRDDLHRAGLASDAVALGGLGLLVCLLRPVAVAGDPMQLSPTEWAALSVALGLAAGLAGAWFLDRQEPVGGRVLVLLALAGLTGGAALRLELAGPLVAMLAGATIALATARGRLVPETREVGGPVFLGLLLVAGVLWTPPPLVPAVAMVLFFLLARLAAKAATGFAAATGSALPNDLWRGLLGQGETALAVAVAFRLLYEGPAVDLAYTAVLASVVLHAAIAPRATEGLLVDMGESRVEPVGG